MANRNERNENAAADGRGWSVPIFRYLVTVSLIGTVLLMGFGMYSVAIRGWMSCGDQFPLCSGSLVPMLTGIETTSYTMTQIYVEWLHRAISFVTGIVMLAATILAWRRVRGYELTTWIITLATALLPFEAYLGVLVGVPNPPTTLVAIHLVISYTVLIALIVATGIVWWSWRRTSRRESKSGYAN